MKVWLAHVPYQHRGGEDVHVEHLFSWYQQSGASVTLVPGGLQAKSTSLKASILSLCVGGASTEEWVKRLQDERPDWVHLHNIYPILGPAFLEALIETSTPAIMTVHNHRLFCTNGLALRDGHICKDCKGTTSTLIPVIRNCNQDLKKSIYYTTALNVSRKKELFKKAIQRWIAPSPYIAAELETLGVKKSRIHILMNPLPDGVGAKVGDSPKIRDYLFAGRISQEKGVNLLVEAAHLCPELRIGIAGDGPLRKQLEQKSPTNVEWLGPLSREQVLDEIRRSKAGVLPSICHEILPTFVLECQRLEVPCVVSDLESTAWLVLPPRRGMTFKMGDARDLADVLRRELLSPPKVRSKNYSDGLLTGKEFVDQLVRIVSTPLED